MSLSVPIDVSWLCCFFHMHFPPFSGSINHRCLFPQDWVEVVTCMLYNGRLFKFSLYSSYYNLFPRMLNLEGVAYGATYTSANTVHV